MRPSRPPTNFTDLPFALPPSEALPGEVLALPEGRLLVRAYDTSEAFTAPVNGASAERYQFDVADLRVESNDEAGAPNIGDTVMYLGEVRGDDQPNLWHPMRVVHMDTKTREKSGGPHEPRGTFLRTWCLADLSVSSSRLEGEQCLPRHMLTGEWPLIEDLAMSGRAATVAEARSLLAVFDCERVLDRKRGWR